MPTHEEGAAWSHPSPRVLKDARAFFIRYSPKFECGSLAADTVRSDARGRREAFDQKATQEAMMFHKVVIATALISAFSMPAFAATEYWVAKDATTHKCQVVSKKPDGTKMMDAGNKMYSSHSRAQTAMKEMTACK